MAKKKVAQEPPRVPVEALTWKEYAPLNVHVDAWLDANPGTELFVGWWFSPYDKGRVAQGCANRFYHSTRRTECTTSQRQGGPWYMTELEATQALRVAKQTEYAKALAAIDARISSLSGETPA